MTYKSKASESIEKEAARRYIWGSFKQSNATKVLFMPSSEVEEPNLALKFGFKPENLYLVDQSAAVLATCTRKMPQWFRKSNRMAGLVSEVSEQWAKKEIKVDAMHLDFCASAPTVYNEVRKVAASNILQEGLIAVTISNGRESGKALENLSDLGYNDLEKGRINLLESALKEGYNDTSIVNKTGFYGKYFNEVSKYPMIWVIFQIKKKYTPHTSEKCHQICGSGKSCNNYIAVENYCSPHFRRLYGHHFSKDVRFENPYSLRIGNKVTMLSYMDANEDYSSEYRGQQGIITKLPNSQSWSTCIQLTTNERLYADQQDYIPAQDYSNEELEQAYNKMRQLYLLHLQKYPSYCFNCGIKIISNTNAFNNERYFSDETLKTLNLPRLEEVYHERCAGKTYSG